MFFKYFLKSKRVEKECLCLYIQIRKAYLRLVYARRQRKISLAHYIRWLYCTGPVYACVYVKLGVGIVPVHKEYEFVRMKQMQVVQNFSNQMHSRNTHRLKTALSIKINLIYLMFWLSKSLYNRFYLPSSHVYGRTFDE